VRPTVRGEELLVHLADLAQVRAVAHDATACMPAAELAAVRRYPEGRRRAQAETSRLLARAVLGRALGRPPLSVPIVVDERGYPWVTGADGDRLCFNVSHDSGLVALVLGRHSCGIDVEDAAEEDLREVAGRFSAAGEGQVPGGQVPGSHAPGTANWARQLWTAKESAAKAMRWGLRAGLSSIRFVDDPGLRWAGVTWRGRRMPLRTRAVDLGIRHLALTSAAERIRAVRVHAWQPWRSGGRWWLVEAEDAGAVAETLSGQLLTGAEVGGARADAACFA
jgi:phosphopantetheinyl transferase